jgi:malonate decarboxylase gamma subunit
MADRKLASFIGKGRQALEMIVDSDSFVENRIGSYTQDADLGPGAVIGDATLKGRSITVIANDAKVRNPRFPTVMAGIIGMEEAYKMAIAVYKTIEADMGKPRGEKRPILLVVDTPGNAPGKIDEIFGMNKATGAYQLALAEAREYGHPVIAIVVGRAISGAFLCHGLQADRILALSGTYGTMIHVMPLGSIARITRMDIERLEKLSASNPVFASGAAYFHKLGGLDEVLEDSSQMADAIDRHIKEIIALNETGRSTQLGPWGRGILGAERGGRLARAEVLQLMQEQFSAIESEFLD